MQQSAIFCQNGGSHQLCKDGSPCRPLTQRQDLDFTRFFDDPLPPAPEITPARQQKISEETQIGARNLQDQGRYIRVVTGSKDRPPAPANAHVLVVEDDEATALLLERVLFKNGYKVSTAHNRDEIVASLTRGQLPDLILLDVMLPDTNGFEVLMRVRANTRLKSTRVMMLTSLGAPGDVSRGLALGVDGYLTKPVSPAVLVQAIRECMGWE